MTEMLVNTTVVIILQYVNASNQYIVHVKLTQCSMSIKFQFKNKMFFNKLLDPGHFFLYVLQKKRGATLSGNISKQFQPEL